MNDAVSRPGHNVIDFIGYRDERRAGAIHAQALRQLCRHCGATLGEGDSADDCSSVGLSEATPRRMFRAD